MSMEKECKVAYLAFLALKDLYKEENDETFPG